MCGTINPSLFRLTEEEHEEFELQKEFDEANQKYFEGKLRPVPMAYKKMPPLARVRATVSKSGRRITRATVKSMEFNTQIQFTRDQFLSSLLHEMCHLYMLQNAEQFNWRGGYHGYEWKALAARVSKMSGIEIKESDDPGLHTRKDIPGGIVVFMGKLRKDKSPGIGYTSASIWNRKSEEWIRQLRDRGWYFVVIKTNKAKAMGYANKSVSKPQMYQIPDEDLDAMLDNVMTGKADGEVLYDYFI